MLRVSVFDVQKNAGFWGKLVMEGDKRTIAERREKSVEEYRQRAIEVSAQAGLLRRSS